MGKGRRNKGKTEDHTIWLCDGVSLLNHPEITNGGRNGESNPYAQGKKRFSLGKSRRKQTSIGTAAHTDSRGIAAKSLLILLITAGTTLGFLSAIELLYGAILILIAYSLMAVYFCNLFRSGKLWVRDVGYTVFLVVFFLFIVVFRRYVNSGFYAIVNQFLVQVTDYYRADEVKVFSETIENRVVTVPFAAIALGVIPIIILNIFLNTYMSVFWSVILSLPLFLLPLFFQLEPDVIYMFMIFVGIIGVLCLKGNGHFRITDREETFDYNRKKKRLLYRHSDRASRQVVFYTAVFCILICGVTMIVKPVELYLYRYQDSSAKDKIEEPLGNLIMYGIESLWNSYNVGGLANGQLGKVSDVTYDGETDLSIRFVPYSSDTIYLKSFVGDTYSFDHWERDADGLYPSPETDDVQRMDVTTESDLGNTAFYPYYTVYDTELGELFRSQDLSDASETRTDVSIIGGTCRLYLYFTTDMEAVLQTTSVDDKYLYVPEDNLASIQTFCEAAGIQNTDTTDEKISKVYAYFVQEYPYTLHPGATPKDEDYVNYFLDTTKKGLCANYATAGALILRYLGISTRYVEGYAVGYEDVLDGYAANAEIDSSAFDVYYKDGEPSEDLPVMDVSVTDRSAHAWIEAFIDGRWQVVELTPPSNEEEEEEQEDFWTKLARLLAGDEDDDEDTAESDSDSGSTFSLSRNLWILYLVVGLAGGACLLVVLLLVIRKLLRIAGYHGRDKTSNMIAYYKYICDYMRFADDEFDRADSHLTQLYRMAPDGDAKGMEELAAYLESVSYGGKTVAEEYEARKRQLHDLFKKRKRQIPFFHRVHIFMKL